MGRVRGGLKKAGERRKKEKGRGVGGGGRRG